MQKKYDKHRGLKALSLSVSFVFLCSTLTDEAHAENVNTLTQLEKRIAKLPPASQIKPYIADSTQAPWQARLSTGKTPAPVKSHPAAIASRPAATVSQPTKIAGNVQPQSQSLSEPLPKEFSESFRVAANLPADYLKNGDNTDYAEQLGKYMQYAADRPGDENTGENVKLDEKHLEAGQLAETQKSRVFDTKYEPLTEEEKRNLVHFARTDTTLVDPIDRKRQQPPADSREVALNTSEAPENKFAKPFLQSVQGVSEIPPAPEIPSGKMIVADTKSDPAAGKDLSEPVVPSKTISNLPWLAEKKPSEPVPATTLASSAQPVVQSVRLETVQSLGTATVQAPNTPPVPKTLLEPADPSEAPVAAVKVSDLPPTAVQIAQPALPMPTMPAPAASNVIPLAPSTPVPQSMPQPVIKTSAIPATGQGNAATSAGPLFIAPAPSPVNSASTQQDSGLSAQSKDILKHLPPEKAESSKSPEPVEINHARENVVESYADEKNHKGVGIQISIKQPKANVTRMLENAYNDLLAGDQEDAISLYNQVLQAEPANKLALFGLATTYQRAGQIQLARPLYGKLLAIDPHNVEGLNNFLVLLADEDPKDALVELDKLERTHPGLSTIPAQEAIIYEKSGDYDMASKKMAIAVNLSPENLKFRYDMAIILDKKGDWAGASMLYKQLLTASERGEKIAANPEEIQERLTFIMSNRPKVQPTDYYYGNN